MRIGILGGTFNPIHNTHIKLATESMAQLGLDKVIFITSASPPHKAVEHGVDDEVRHRMVELAIKDIPHFEASRIELDRRGKSYTYYTIVELKKKYPKSELFFIVGGDSIDYIEQWHRADELLRLCSFAVYPRGDVVGGYLQTRCEWLERVYGAVCYVLDVCEDEVSSTVVRRLFAEGDDIKGLVPKAVEEFILSSRIYKGDKNG